MQTTASVGEDVGRLEPLGAAGRNVRDCRCYRKQFGVRGTAKRPVGLQRSEQRRRLGPVHVESFRLFIFAGAIESPPEEGNQIHCRGTERTRPWTGGLVVSTFPS